MFFNRPRCNLNALKNMRCFHNVPTGHIQETLLGNVLRKFQMELVATVELHVKVTFEM
jgi:hypothetical protein